MKKEHLSQVVLLTGSNLGNRAAYLQQAFEHINKTCGKVILFSGIYESEAWGFEAPPFYNQALVVETTLSPKEFLSCTQSIEIELGRERKHPLLSYSSRTIDIDILFFDNLIINTNNLIVPHPKMALRRFVLEPLAEILPYFQHPVLKKTVNELLLEL